MIAYRATLDVPREPVQFTAKQRAEFVAQRLGLGGDVLGGQRRDDPFPVGGEPDLARGADALEAQMPILVTAMFTFPLGADAALLPRTAALTEAYHELLAANQQRLARWEPWAAQPPTPESTRAFLEASGRSWLEGTELPGRDRGARR